MVVKVINFRADKEEDAMIDVLCQQDIRTRSQMMRWLIRQEYARRHSQPSPVVTLGEAVEAGKAINPMVTETD